MDQNLDQHKVRPQRKKPGWALWLPILSLVLAIALGVVGWMAYRLNRLNSQLMFRTENMYQKSFHELTTNLSAIQDETATALAAGDPSQLLTHMTSVWRQVYAARQNLGQLPLGVVQLDKTEEFLTRMGDYAHGLAVDHAGQTLSTDEWNQLKSLHDESRTIAQGLTNVQGQVLGQGLKWMSVEVPTRQSGRDVADNTIIDGFKNVNQQVSQFPEANWGDYKNVVLPPPTALNVPDVTIDQARQTAKAALDPSVAGTLTKITKEEKAGADFPVYMFRFESTGQPVRAANVEVTVAGGKLHWMISDRSVGAPGKDDAALRASAEQYLTGHGFNSMELVATDRYFNARIFTYVYNQDGVLIYPDAVRVTVAEDNGEVICFEGDGYTRYHQQRSLPSPKVEASAVKSKLQPNLTVSNVARAVIFNHLGKETPVYEVQGKIDADRYLVYVNSETGKEEQIVHVPAAMASPTAAAPVFKASSSIGK
jgi:spore germination protein